MTLKTEPKLMFDKTKPNAMIAVKASDKKENATNRFLLLFFDCMN